MLDESSFHLGFKSISRTYIYGAKPSALFSLSYKTRFRAVITLKPATARQQPLNWLTAAFPDNISKLESSLALTATPSHVPFSLNYQFHSIFRRFRTR